MVDPIHAGSPALDAAIFRRTLREMGHSEADVQAEMRRLDAYPQTAAAYIAEDSEEARREVARVWEDAPTYDPHEPDRLTASVTISRTYVGEWYGRQEEGACEWCGAPMFVGDDAYEVRQDGDPLAFADSMHCARRLALQHAETYWIGPARRWSVPPVLRETAPTYRAQGIRWDRFDICSAWHVLAIDYGLYGLFDRIRHEVKYTPGLRGGSFDSLTENAQAIYRAGQERAAQMGPWERAIPTGTD